MSDIGGAFDGANDGGSMDTSGSDVALLEANAEGERASWACSMGDSLPLDAMACLSACDLVRMGRGIGLLSVDEYKKKWWYKMHIHGRIC